MGISVALNTPLADALNEVVQPKLVEVGWSTGGGDDSALAEYVILMLVNGKTQDQISAELANDLLSLGPEDTEAAEFSKWLFEQVETLDRQLNGGSGEAQQEQPPQAIPSFSEDGSGASGGNGDATSASACIPQPDTDMGEGSGPGADTSVPTGPRNMRNQKQGGRGRGILGQLSRAMDRSHESVLHRVRNQQGTERINSHRDGSKGGRGGRGGNRTPMGRQMGNNMQMGMGMGMNMGMNHNSMQNMPQPNMMNMTQQQQMQMMSMFEEQARMMSQFIPGFVAPAINPAFQNGPPPQSQGRSLFERAEFHPGRRAHDRHQPPQGVAADVEMGGDGGEQKPEEHQQREAPGPDTLCRFNLRCTNKDCPYAHQSPAAPEGANVDVNDNCPYGAACKNRKCVARHPSPAQKAVHQSEEICRYFPHCTNPKCTFKHPSMPLCRNGADCTTEDCKFTHVQIPCRFNPCLNRSCQYKHAEGQRGVFGDKVWRADGASKGETPHVSERKFIADETGEEELIKPGSAPSNDAGIIT
ncbi:nuclear polyadenylated RNA-binding protein Nab2 [Arthroderma uncinatum]|uniref:nuclear polyadenylated RNA-binding protein Nab2 n=1 Tax=Arthroderma uncinatum TaxID=74035 RepID=UPI00144AC483|nr:nuclear polyadenylated RNA-binding protein Nab2 [Arthroderma uncinatum]KAF3484427.1 nuclear polyadenylated RNA-binding protein Nab2 [Arthroderma uncinatum]